MSAAFRTLSQGIGGFDKARFGSQVDVFNRNDDPQTSRSKSSSVAGTSKATILPAELDFFGSSSSSAPSKKKSKGKNGATTDDVDDSIIDELSKPKKRKRSTAANEEGEPAVTPATLKSYLRKHRLNLTGTDYPLPVVSWRDLQRRYKLHDWLVEELEEREWDLTSVQRGALSAAMEKRDLLAMAPTGSGKTIAYLLPLIHHLYKSKVQEGSTSSTSSSSRPGPTALILSPTRELATQIYDETRRLLLASPEGQKELLKAQKGKNKKLSSSKGLRVALLTGGERIQPIEGNEAGAATGGKGGKFDVVIATPLRLAQAVELEGWTLSNVQQVVLDEADTLLSSTFLEQTDVLLSLCTSSTLQKSLFSATLPSSIETLSKTFLSPDSLRLIAGNKDASSEDVDQSLKFVGSEEGKLFELRSMIKLGQVRPPCLLFVQSIQRAKDLYEELVYDGLRLDTIHSDQSRTKRESVIASFKKGDIWLLICTEVLSRGLDFKGVELVINYDFPLDTTSYIHRIGRTGRAGRKGQAVTFFTKEDVPQLRSVVNLIKASNPSALDQIPEYLLQLKKVGSKEKKKRKTRPLQRKDIGEASGSRVLELDEQERRQGRRIMEKKNKKGKQQREEDEDESSEDDDDDE